MEVLQYALAITLFAVYYFLFARHYISKYRQGGVIITKHKEKPLKIVPPGPFIRFSSRFVK